LGGSTTLGPSVLWGRTEERKENAETNHHPRTLQPSCDTLFLPCASNSNATAVNRTRDVG
jgi:hypothetical protein